MPAVSHEFDVCLLGGGIAGLWTLARLGAAGYSAVLLETQALGAGQTIWSQGIIHGGIKYALTGEASAASKAIAAMPEVWNACLTGGGTGDGHGVDLSSVKPLSACQYLWTTPGIVSRIAGVAASKAIRTPVERLERDAWPAEFSGAPKGVDLYRVAEPVLPTGAMVEALCRGSAGAMAAIEAVEGIEEVERRSDGATERRRDGGGAVVRARLAGGESVAIAASRVICCAGAGNEALCAMAGVVAPMQRRPLHMVMARSPSSGKGRRGVLPAIFGHCLGASIVPRVTITTVDEPGERVWYIGGGLAETGVERSEAAQVDAAQAEVATCVPWVDLARVTWSTGRIDRAEGVTESGRRPDQPVIVAQGAVIVAWPTKLAFAPAVAGEILRLLGEAGIRPSGVGPNRIGEPPSLARPPWVR